VTMQILENFSKASVLVVGDIMLDRFWWGTVSRISPEAPVPVVRLKRTTLAAGGAANVATNIAGLGAKAFLIGTVGSDSEADLIRQLLDQSGVSPEHIVESTGRHTTVKTRVIANGQQVTRIDQEDDSALEKAVEDLVLQQIRDLIPRVDAVVVSDYAKGLLSDHIVSQIISLSREEGKPVLVDPKGKVYQKYRGASLLTPNRREAAEACNLDESCIDLVDRAGAELMSTLDIGALLITQGEEGMTLFRRDHDRIHFAVSARQVYDVTGAGDTVIATLAASVAAGVDLEGSARLANVAAGLVVEQVGTTAISAHDLATAISSLDRA
jgi:rfaE bifunctional protein kinase chain/domain